MILSMYQSGIVKYIICQGYFLRVIIPTELVFYFCRSSLASSRRSDTVPKECRKAEGRW